MDKPVSALRKLPSVDEVMRSAALAEAVAHYGRSAAVTAGKGQKTVTLIFPRQTAEQ